MPSEVRILPSGQYRISFKKSVTIFFAETLYTKHAKDKLKTKEARKFGITKEKIEVVAKI